MKPIQFNEKAYTEFVEWADDDPGIFRKIDKLLRDIRRDPFKGLGKPEPLKHEWKGFWSRRITDEHRMIYRFSNDVIYVASLKDHYP